VTAAQLPPITDAKPPETPAAENPVEKAALKARLAEMERAEAMVREAAVPQQPHYAAEPLAIEPQEPQQQPQTVEQIVSSSGLPKRAQDWLLQHPDYVTDPVKNAKIQKLHHVAEYHAGGEFTDLYFDRLDHLLGFKQEQPSGNGARQTTQPTVQRQAAPPVRQQSRVPMSAPPHREVPSFTTGRAPSRRVPLTAEQREIARASRITDEEYARQLETMNRMKEAGALQGDR
jgi:hypothetical protein